MLTRLLSLGDEELVSSGVIVKNECALQEVTDQHYTCKISSTSQDD